MKDPGFLKLIWLGAAASFVAAGVVLAQPPEAAPNKRTVVRPRPQVIYHLPPSSNYAATLHSQAKGQNIDRPVDGDTPTSLQMSRPNPNASATKAREEAVAAGPQPPQQQPSKHPKTQSVRRAKSPSLKAKGPGHGGPRKSHKK